MTSATIQASLDSAAVRPSPVPSRARATRIRAAVLRAEVGLAVGAPVALRLSLALVFLWFGALKIVGASPVVGLISATLPWADPHIAVGALGVFEAVLGVGLLTGRAQRLLLLALAAHLAGTFLTFLVAPGLMVQHHNPLLLTADGEFVLKNLVLITAALLLVTRAPGLPGRAEPSSGRTHPFQVWRALATARIVGVARTRCCLGNTGIPR